MLFGCSEPSRDTDGNNQVKLSNDLSATYIGKKECVRCHQEQNRLWQDSHHDLAMQPANEHTVLGDFGNASFDYFGTTSRFYKKDNQFYVRTDGPDGKLADYPVAYTFGIQPLQQYLIKFPKGHYQALSIVWDTRSKKEGGQRWFHLYPNEPIKHNDELHWTSINQNWNFMCADCHSTNLQKNYDANNKAYNTSWSDIDVSCEACHGPASRHIVWAENNSTDIKNKGFSVVFDERVNVDWTIDPVTGNAKRSQKKQTHTEITACAQCHARRSANYPGAEAGKALLDNYRVALLTDPLYHADGQINGEVYVYGSYVQSKMYHAGVTCSDCHEPHSLKLRTSTKELCAGCHSVTKYDSTEHHLHNLDTQGPQCVDCHMPAKDYMVVDPRRDHSFRIPRPDLSVTLAVPNVCTQCHMDKTPQWAATKLEQKNGKPMDRHYAKALHAGRRGLPDAEELLSELITDAAQPGIARATAVTLLPPYLSKQSVGVLQTAANDKNHFLGFGLAISLDSIPVEKRLPFAYPLLYDNMRSTRMLAARALLGMSLQNLPEDATARFNQAIKEYAATELFNADRPESLVNLAGFYAARGQTQKAMEYYQNAINLAPYYTPAYINLADLYRGLGDEIAGEAVLHEALSRVRDKTVIQHTLGLQLVRQKKLPEAINYLRLAAQSLSTTDRYVYVYAIALHSSGQVEQALEVLEQAHQQYPVSTDILSALVSINTSLGNQDSAQFYENKLHTLNR